MGLSLARPARSGADDGGPPAEAERAATTDDGHRAWVIRDSLSKLDPAAARCAARLASPASVAAPGAPATSTASDMAARFGGLPDPTHHPEPPLT